MNRQTVYTIRTQGRYFDHNPRGSVFFFWTRDARDKTAAGMVEDRQQAGLADPASDVVCGKTSRSRDFLMRLESQQVLRANGIDAPQDGPTLMWGGQAS